MIQYFYGEDQYAIFNQLQTIVATQQAVVKWVEAGDLIKQRDWREQLQPGPSLFQREIIVVRDVSALPVEYQKELADVLKSNVISDLTIWDVVTPDKRSVLFKALKPFAKEYVYPDDVTVVKQVQAAVQAQGGTITPRAAQWLVHRIGKNGWRWRSEIARLLLITDAITEAVVAAEIPAPLEAEIFQTIEAIARGEAKLALTKLTDMLEQDDNVFYILSMLAYQFKTLYLVKTGQAAAKKVHPYVIQKSQSLVARFTAQQLLDILTKILAIDVSIKQGKIDPRTGLTMAVLGLVQQKSQV